MEGIAWVVGSIVVLFVVMKIYDCVNHYEEPEMPWCTGCGRYVGVDEWNCEHCGLEQP